MHVAAQRNALDSLLHFYQRLLAVRRSTPALRVGDYRAVDQHNPHGLTFLRHDPTSGQTCLVTMNFLAVEQIVILDRADWQLNTLVAHPLPLAAAQQGQLRLAPFGLIIAQCFRN